MFGNANIYFVFSPHIFQSIQKVNIHAALFIVNTHSLLNSTCVTPFIDLTSETQILNLKYNAA